MRTLTLVVKVEDIEKAGWIWESLQTHTPLQGVRVVCLLEGDFINEPLEWINSTLNQDSPNKP